MYLYYTDLCNWSQIMQQEHNHKWREMKEMEI